MFLITWIEAEEINYCLVKGQELSNFIQEHDICSLDNHLMVQELAV